MLDADRINRWRIDDFRSEVAELHRFDITQFWNDISGTDDLGVCCHEAVHIGPNLQDACFQSRSNNAGSIVATTSSQVRRLATLDIGTDETSNDANLRHFLPSLANKIVGQLANQTVLSCLELGLDELAAVKPLCILDECCNYLAANAFAIRNNGSLRLWTKVVNEINALINAAQFLEQTAYCSREFVALLASRNDAVYHLFMARLYLLERLLIERIALNSHQACSDEFIRDSAKSANHDDNGL